MRAADGAFSCEEGSEPECEDGATPTLSSTGASLVCMSSPDPQAGYGEAECTQEGEAEGACSAAPSCAAQASEGSGCEGEDASEGEDEGEREG